MPPRRCLILLVAVILVQSARAESTPVSVHIIDIAAPAGVEASSMQWAKIETVNSGTMLAAVARPQGKGPFPAVLIVHGSHGFAREYLALVGELASHELIAVAACWFQGGIPGNESVSAPIDCPQAGPIPMGPSAAARSTITDLVAAVRMLPGVRPDRIALFGHSRGAGATINYLEHGGAARAAVLNSSGYPDEYIAAATQIHASVFVLHGMKDTNADFTRFERAQQFAEALRAAKVPLQTQFYPEGVHSGMFSDRRQHDDEVARIVKFLREELR